MFQGSLTRDEETLPEKPLETEIVSEADNSTKDVKKVGKKSKFKSIFTKSVSLRNLQQSDPASSGIISPQTKGLTGKGDNEAANKGLPMSKSSTNIFKEENVTVQIHRDPFLVGPGPCSPPKLPSSPSPKVAPSSVLKSPKITVSAASDDDDERIPQRPQPHFETKYSVNKENESRSSLGRNIAKRSQKRSTSGSRNNSKPSSSGDKNQCILDPRILKRRNAKIKEKAKTRELLLLVEELANNCEYYKNSLQRKEDRQEMESYQVRKENESLNLQIFKMSQEIEEWREHCKKMESKSTALSKVKSLSKENKEFLEDIEVLKSVICRLNKELSHYQDKLRSKYKDSPENIITYSTTTSGTDDINEQKDPHHQHQESYKFCSGWVQNSRKTLLPLLIAYDEVIAEKEEIIRDHEVALDRFKAKCMEVTNENADLHKLISSSKERGTISIDEWESLRSNAVVVLEENDLLHEQVSNLQRKEEKLFSTFQEKATGFKQTISQLETEISKQKIVVADLESRCSRLTEENGSMNSALQNRIPREKHEAMMQEFKHAFDELKSNYDSEKKKLIDDLSSTTNDKEHLSEVVVTLEDENTRLQNHVQECESSLAANAVVIQKLKSSLEEHASTSDAANGIIEDFMRHAQQLSGEREKLVEELREERLVNEQIMSFHTQENALVGDLHNKIEAKERLHNEEMKKAQHRIREIEEKLKIDEERHQREKAQFAELLKEKDRRVEYVEAEKRQLQQDLETVWKTTTSTIQNSIKSRADK